MNTQETIDIKQWGRDHWSLLAYIGSNLDGRLRIVKMRCNPERHPLNAHSGGWRDSYSTRLKTGELVQGHDDWNCLEDMEAAGLIEIISTVNPVVTLTDRGHLVLSELRKHIQQNLHLKEFSYNG